MFYPALLILLLLHSSSSQPIQEQIQESVTISNYSGPLNEHSIGTYFDRVGYLEIKNSHITDLSKDSTVVKSEDDIFPDCCPTLKNLTVSNWMNFEEEDLKGIGVLPLETLIINHQNLSVLGDDILKNTDLRYLSLDSNSIKNMSNAVFDDLYQLERLSLSWNGFEELPKDILSPLKKLKSLQVETDKFKKFSLVNLTYLPELTEIYLSKKGIQEVNLWGIEEKAPKLKDLFLVGNDGVVTSDDNGPTIHF